MALIRANLFCLSSLKAPEPFCLMTEKDGVKGFLNITIPFSGRYVFIAATTGSMVDGSLKIRKTFYKEVKDAKH
jgi:hypothetical protein